MPRIVRHRFTFGPMGAGKSAALIELAARLDAAGVEVGTYVPAALGAAEVRSRTGACRAARRLAAGREADELAAHQGAGAALIDDAHMLDPDQLRAMVRWADGADVELHLYGLLLDFRSQLFDASTAALESVDEWCSLEVRARCWCGELAVRNGRLEDGRFVREGPVVVAGPLADEGGGGRAPVEVAYVQLCRRHWLAGEVAPA